MRVLILAVLLAGCVHRPVAVGEPVIRANYGYVRMEDGSYWLVVSKGANLQDALKDMGCGKRAVCMVEIGGNFYRVSKGESK